MKRIIRNIVLMSAAIIIPMTASAQSAVPAKAALCQACHGAKGAAPIAPNYPKLAGQNKGYLVSSLKAYKSGERKAGLAVLMVGQSKQLTEAEINELATYYASQ